MKTADMLTPEERELARLLGRPGSAAAAPSAQLDARIIALSKAPPAQSTTAVAQPNDQGAAQAHASSPTALPPSAARGRGWGRRRGLVSSLAVAASLVLVVGLAWQLRPLDAPPSAPASAEAPAPVAADDSSTGAAPARGPEPAAAPMLEQPTDPATASAPVAAAPAKQAAVKERRAATPEPAPARASRKAEASVAESAASMTADEPAPRAFSAAPASAPPAPPAPPAPVTMPAPIAAPAYTEQANSADAAQNQLYRSQSPPARTAPPRPAFTGPAPIPHAGAKAVTKAAEARRQRAAAIAADSTADIEADAMLSRRQWLKRIRERQEAGDIPTAKASLRRFAHDYPEARIPHDLRPLLED